MYVMIYICVHFGSQQSISTDRRYEEFWKKEEIIEWSVLTKQVQRYFQACVQPSSITYTNSSIFILNSLFHCTNSSKFISHYRRLDGVPDCVNAIDELSADSCDLLIKQKHRYKCANHNICISLLLLLDRRYS